MFFNRSLKGFISRNISLRSGNSINNRIAGDVVGRRRRVLMNQNHHYGLATMTPKNDETISNTVLDNQLVLEKVADPTFADLSYYPTDCVIRGLLSVHEYTGLPWYATIAVTTIALRTTLVPLVIKSMKNINNLKLAKPEIDRIKQLPEPLTQEDRDKHIKLLRDVYAKYNVNPLASMLPVFAQMPLFIFFFLGLRRMSQEFPSFKEGGIYWFTDLSVHDPTWIMPVLASAGFLVTIELGGEAGEQSSQTKQMKNVFRGLAVAMIPLTAFMPQGVFVYWITSNTFSLCQTLTFKIPGVKQLFGIESNALNNDLTLNNNNNNNNSTVLSSSTSSTTTMKTQLPGSITTGGVTFLPPPPPSLPKVNNNIRTANTTSVSSSNEQQQQQNKEYQNRRRNRENTK